MTGDMVSSSDLADLTRSAEAVEDRSKELAGKQAETLEKVSEELLCSPEIIRQGLVSPDCVKENAIVIVWCNHDTGDSLKTIQALASSV